MLNVSDEEDVIYCSDSPELEEWENKTTVVTPIPTVDEATIVAVNG